MPEWYSKPGVDRLRPSRRSRLTVKSTSPRELDRRLDHEVIVELQRQVRVVRRAHDLVQLLARADADDLVRQVAAPSPRARSTMRTDGIFGTKISPPCMRSKFLSTKSTPCCSVIQKRVMRASVIGRWSQPLGDQLAEERHDRAARADHVAVAHDGEAGPVAARDVVGGDEQLVGDELGRAVEVDRVGRLVGGERDHLLDVVRQRRVDDVLRAMDVGLDALQRVVFGRRHLLERRGVDHEVDAVASPACSRSRSRTSPMK